MALALSVLLAAAPVWAGDTKAKTDKTAQGSKAAAEKPAGTVKAAVAVEKKSTTRTLKGLIDLVMKHGQEKDFSDKRGPKLGFPGKITTKAIGFGIGKTSDKLGHSLYVAYKLDDGKPEPYNLIFAQTNLTGENSKFATGWDIRTGLDGEILSALYAEGMVGAVQFKDVPIDDQQNKAILQKEIDFFLTDKMVTERLSD